MSDDQYSINERLDLYVKRVNELIATQAVQTGAFNIQLSFQFAREQGLKTASREPNEELLRSFLLTFRQFVSDKEPVFANGIANICWQELRSDELRGHLEAARRRWFKACRAGPLKVVIDEDHLSPENALDIWINGKYFHNDKRKAERIKRLDPLGLLLSRHVFLNHIITATDYVVFLGQIVMVGRRQGLLD